MNQMTLDLGLAPMVNPERLFWCCANCFPQTGGRTSLMWQPPDYMTGQCVLCGRTYRFESKYGEDELVEAGGKVQ